MNFSLDLICRAQHRLRGLVRRTPLIHSATLSAHLGAPTYLKLECLQKTGSFKPRGAFNRLLEMSADERQRGVVAVSGGNHAQGVAYAAKQLGIAATICMPASTPRNYLDATRGYGAEIVLCPDIKAAFAPLRWATSAICEVRPITGSPAARRMCGSSSRNPIGLRP